MAPRHGGSNCSFGGSPLGRMRTDVRWFEMEIGAKQFNATPPAGAANDSAGVQELAEWVPDRARTFWRERVLSPYEARLYGLALEGSFRVLELAVALRCQELGARTTKFKPGVQWLRSQGLMPRLEPIPGVELWETAAGGRDEASHYLHGPGPIRTNKGGCDIVLPAHRRMIEGLWGKTAKSVGDF